MKLSHQTSPLTGKFGKTALAATGAVLTLATLGCGGADPGTVATQPAGSVATESTPVAGLTDGVYTGEAKQFRHGTVQTTVTISGGQITSIDATYPTEAHSAQINQKAIPQLVEEAIATQSSDLTMITGATMTSQAFAGSLQSALNQARG